MEKKTNKVYFVAKCADMLSLKKSVHTGIWACGDRRDGPQPSALMTKYLDQGYAVFLVFSVSNHSGWHGVAEMISAPGSISEERHTSISNEKVPKNILEQIEPKTLNCQSWHRFSIRWIVSYYPNHGEKCLPFRETENLRTLLCSPINKARNYDELPLDVGLRLHSLIEVSCQAMDEEKLKQNKQVNYVPFFRLPDAESDNLSHNDIWTYFIKEVNKLGTVLLACAFGSQRYNVATEQSDLDMFVVYAAESHQVLGLSPPEQTIKNKENEAYDYTVHELHRFCQLLIGGDPRCVESLFLHQNSVYFMASEWRELVKNRNVFLTRQLIDKYLRDATGAKGLRLMQKWTSNGIALQTPMPPKVGKLFYIILRLLQNASHVTKGYLQVYRSEGSEEYDLLMSARSCSKPYQFLMDIIKSHISSLEEYLRDLDGSTLEYNEGRKIAEIFLLNFRYQNLKSYMENS